MRLLVFFSFLFAAAIVAIKLGFAFSIASSSSLLADPAMLQAQNAVNSVSSGAWEFGRPLLQLLVVLILGEWFVSRLGLNVRSVGLGSINIQTFIAIAVVFTFCLAALGDLPGLVYLKDVVLIVIGFYFGTKSRQEVDVETKTEDSKNVQT